MQATRHIIEAAAKGTLRVEERPTDHGNSYWAILDGDELIEVVLTEAEVRDRLPPGFTT